MKELETILNKLTTHTNWGTYYMGKYYFTIKTQKRKTEIGLTKKNWELSIDVQRLLQRENYTAIFHEYIHYLHEMSTIIGNVGIGLDMRSKSIISHNFKADLNSSENLGVIEHWQFEHLSKIIVAQGVIFGSSNEVIQNGIFIKVESIELEQQDLWLPHGNDYIKMTINVPRIEFDLAKDESIKRSSLYLGKYFMYEGIAYELDRQIEKNITKSEEIKDTLKGSEYIVLREIAKYVFPEVEPQVFLSLATMSLQHIDSGATFISLLKRVKEQYEFGLMQMSSVALIKEKVSKMLDTKRLEFNEAQEEYKKVYQKREQLSFALGYITSKAKELYDQRIKNPTFEIDSVFEKSHLDLLDFAEMCDYMYLFDDDEEFMRDFIGTTIDEATSQSLKVLLSYDHYHKSHQIFSTVKIEVQGEYMCPFYYCCNLDLRKIQAENCRSKPWRNYEISADTDKRFCWYGKGVGEFKGQNII